uniref:Uncharacterized protein n=1 Tax=Acrobeloides nanus TaxID=290746 RepID=A0A914EGQ5_9BILA
SSVSADVYNDDGEDDAFQPGASEEPVPAKQKRRKAEVVEVSPQESYKFGGRKYLSRTFTIYGHAKPVISIAANDELLITGSKDRTAKIWDLHTGTEKCVLKSHPNNVTAVKLVPNNPNMALTVSLFTVKVWDLRMPTCVHHLNSSGIAEEGWLYQKILQKEIKF